MRRGGGLITAADLAGYRPIDRTPLRGSYRDCEILALPPSSSGGTTLPRSPQHSRNVRPSFRRAMVAANAPSDDREHEACLPRSGLLTSAIRTTTTIPGKLVDKQYARDLAATIDLARATPSEDLAGEIPITRESEQTTHVSVIDRWRTAVSLTYTLESAFGSKVVVPGGGFLLNDEMNDFNWVPGVTNLAGRHRHRGQRSRPRKTDAQLDVSDGRATRRPDTTDHRQPRRPHDHQYRVVHGHQRGRFRNGHSPGSRRPRLHHQWLPDRVRIEPALLEEYPKAIEQLRQWGHVLADKPARRATPTVSRSIQSQARSLVRPIGA